MKIKGNEIRETEDYLVYRNKTSGTFLVTVNRVKPLLIGQIIGLTNRTHFYQRILRWSQGRKHAFPWKATMLWLSAATMLGLHGTNTINSLALV